MLTQIAIEYLRIRDALKVTKAQEVTLRQQLQTSQGELDEAFVKQNESADQDLLLSSFAIVQGQTCYTFIFSDDKLHTLVEGPVLLD